MCARKANPGGTHARSTSSGETNPAETQPAQSGRLDGLAYTLWTAPSPRTDHAGIVILHGAGSCKENHHDFARAATAAGFAAICFDQRGHGESDGALGAGAARDVAAIAGLLRGVSGDAAPIARRGSSMGGYHAIVSAPVLDAAALVAICPASSGLLRRGLAQRTFEFRVDADAFDAFLVGNDLIAAAQKLSAPTLIMHAEGDDHVPVEQSRAVEAHVGAPGSRLIVIPGGDHRSIQHDAELQALSLRFLEEALGGPLASAAARGSAHAPDSLSR